jgi:hypothetical protein
MWGVEEGREIVVLCTIYGVVFVLFLSFYFITGSVSASLGTLRREMGGELLGA